VAGAGAGWTQELELLACVYDRLSQQVWQAGGKATAPKPTPFPRPGAAPAVHRTSLSPGQIHGRLVEQRRRRELEVADGC